MTSRRMPPVRPSWRFAASLVALFTFVGLQSACGDDSPTEVNDPPTVHITAPGADLVANEGETVNFAGSASDDEGTLPAGSLVWTSSIDGEIGTGASFTRSDLSTGVHTITLRATDADGAAASASTDLVINGIPVAAIASPSMGTMFGGGEEITFTGSATDDEDATFPASSLVWTSSVDGQIGTGASVTSAELSTGPHTVTLTATDSHGATAQASVDVEINDGPASSILLPADGSVIMEGAAVDFMGEATDTEDGPLDGASLVWTSSLDGEVGTGASFSRSDLSAGVHTITLTASDSRGTAGATSVEIAINRAPSAQITSPTDGAEYEAGATITFDGSATDADDGALSGGSLVWTSDIDGEIGTGVSFTRADLSEGAHVVTLTATDSDGATGSASVGITVGPTSVQAHEPVTGISGAANSMHEFVFYLDADDGADLLRVSITGGSGDADLYVRYGSQPTLSTYDCRPYQTTSEETCQFAAPAAGAWYILVHAYEDISGVTLLVETESSSDACSLGDADSDLDRLPDCAETGTGSYVNTLDTGTDPANPDTDADGIADGDEVLGTMGGLDLPSMGVSPLRQDILLEYDWFNDALDCASHSHRPTASQLALVTATFAAAPIDNPDGSTGINFIHDYGQGGSFTGGNLVDDADGVIAGGVFGSDYGAYKAANFDANRNGYFHYVLMPHRYNLTSTSSGQASIFGDDMIVSLQCSVSGDSPVAHTIVHELGHNLGLRHGGLDTYNWKPNYNSVMNYAYQFPGVDDNCTPPGDGVLDFSHGQNPDLDENSLTEADGICGAGGGSWDWNGDGDSNDAGFAFDINVDREGVGDAVFDVLSDNDDWASIQLSVLGGATAGMQMARTEPEPVSCMPTPQPVQERF